jgi:excisionase family DNA binding protein
MTYQKIDFAESYLKVARVTIYRAISNGKLRAFKPNGGKSWYFLESDLQKYLSGSKIETEAQIEN